MSKNSWISAAWSSQCWQCHNAPSKSSGSWSSLLKKALKNWKTFKNYFGLLNTQVSSIAPPIIGTLTFGRWKWITWWSWSCWISIGRDTKCQEDECENHSGWLFPLVWHFSLSIVHKQKFISMQISHFSHVQLCIKTAHENAVKNMVNTCRFRGYTKVLLEYWLMIYYVRIGPIGSLQLSIPVWHFFTWNTQKSCTNTVFENQLKCFDAILTVKSDFLGNFQTLWVRCTFNVNKSGFGG